MPRNRPCSFKRTKNTVQGRIHEPQITDDGVRRKPWHSRVGADCSLPRARPSQEWFRRSEGTFILLTSIIIIIIIIIINWQLFFGYSYGRYFSAQSQRKPKEQVDHQEKSGDMPRSQGKTNNGRPQSFNPQSTNPQCYRCGLGEL